jgi:hypothetical protein
MKYILLISWDERAWASMSREEMEKVQVLDVDDAVAAERENDARRWAARPAQRRRHSGTAAPQPA